jgi:hypothetical protein
VLPPGVEMGLTELEQSPELVELAATATPLHRPTFWPYILGYAPDATSIAQLHAQGESSRATTHQPCSSGACPG